MSPHGALRWPAPDDEVFRRTHTELRATEPRTRARRSASGNDDDGAPPQVRWGAVVRQSRALSG
ncbi:hypothetical protein GCM10009756_12800 [Pseudokineococcus marinus]